jgi:hypothetical protein
MIGKEIKAIREKFGEAIGNFTTAALSSYITPDIVQIGFGLRPPALRDGTSATHCLFGGQQRAASLLHTVGQLTHGFLSDDAALTMTKRRLRAIDQGENFRAGPLTLLPHEQSFLDCVFFTTQSARLYGHAEERLLVRR